MINVPKGLPRFARKIPNSESMNVSADSKEELEEAIAEHIRDGWRETARTSERDGLFRARLTRSR